MTNEELRRLDAAVAKALGWTEVQNVGNVFGVPPGGAPGEIRFTPEWSRRIEDAWPLAEQFGLMVGPNPDEERGGWVATDHWLNGARAPASRELWVEGETAPEAIARAVLSLKAKGAGK